MEKWDKLSMKDRSKYIQLAVSSGVTDLNDIRNTYNSFAEGGQYSAGKMTDALYKEATEVKSLGEPDHHYDFTQTEEWANAHGYYPDKRGHRDDRVKKPAHPTHPSRGKWNRLSEFQLTELGMKDPNYIMFGMADGDQDPQATLTYNGTIVLPEITVTPKNNYIYNSYDNLNIKLGNQENISNTSNKFLDGGTILKTLTQPLIKTVYDVGKSFITAVNPRNKEPIYQDLSNKKMKDVSKTNKANFVIGNEFSEKNKNTVRKAKDFKHTTDTLLGDRKIPLSKISQFYGMEDGKLKVGSLDIFNKDTEVVPVRNKNVGKIKEVGVQKRMVPDYSDLVNKKYPAPSFWDSLIHSEEANQNRINRINYENELRRNNVKTNKYIELNPRTYFINENNDTIYPSFGQFGTHDKILFSDEKGNAIFIKDIGDEEVFNQLNKALKEKSRYPILIDNGRYLHYEPTGDVDSYPIQGFDTKEDMYLIGY